MIKVIIADDEERICQLINALIDWESMGMKVEGIAHNGLEAIEMVERMKPDILITDIRMPGCSGLELIEQVKKHMGTLEIVIISGYAHFEYAQQAIKFGVGDYLLKPISKTELAATLEKLKGRICQRQAVEESKEELMRKAKKDVRLLQANFLGELVEQEKQPLSAKELAEAYYLELEPGWFQAFWVKMDWGADEVSESSASALMGKVQEVLEIGLRDKSTELAMAVRGFSCVGILNYKKEGRQEIRRAFKNCLNQMEMQKSLFRPVSFSAALGEAYQEAEKLGESMKEASVLIQERIIKGTGRLFDRLGEPSGLRHSRIMERYLREITQAVELLDREQGQAAVELLAEEVRREKDPRGNEIMEMVYSAAEVFTVKSQMPERGERLEEFRQKCGRCSSAEKVFSCLKSFQDSYLRELSEKRENDTIRPIRKAKQYIQNHYSEPITQEEISGIVGLSPAYFSVLFKKTEGEGFAKYLINVRMEQARVLLRETNIPVAEVCRKVGYNDIKHFTHTFEKAAGVKPATYRKLYG